MALLLAMTSFICGADMEERILIATKIVDQKQGYFEWKNKTTEIHHATLSAFRYKILNQIRLTNTKKEYQ